MTFEVGKEGFTRMSNPFISKEEHAYWEGVASRQAEIDCLKIELDGANERALMLLNHKNNMVEKMQAEIDELQKRIDEALHKLDEFNCPPEYGIDEIFKVIDLLKGSQDEN